MSKDIKEVSANMKYEAALKKARAEGTTEAVNYPPYNFTDEGQMLCGKLMGLEIIKSNKNEGDFVRYLIDTDGGPIGVVLGAMADNHLYDSNTQALSAKYLNAGIAITYKGKKTLDGGRTLNTYEIITFAI